MFALHRLPPLCTNVVVRPKLPVATCWLPISETPPMLVWLAAAAWTRALVAPAMACCLVVEDGGCYMVMLSSMSGSASIASICSASCPL